MSQANVSHYKVIFFGAENAGKSTAIDSISHIPVATTEEYVTEVTKKMKEKTSSSLHYGVIKASDEYVVHLYSIRTQKSFNYQWKASEDDDLGLVLLVNNARPKPLDDLDAYLDSYADLIAKSSLVIGITHRDQSDRISIRQYNEHLLSKGMSFPLFDVDARVERDVEILVQALLKSLA